MKSMLDLIKNRLSDNMLTLSGELVITSMDLKSKLLLNDFDRTLLREKIVLIRKAYPDMKVEMCNGLAEIDIKFFAHKMRIHTEDFLEDFNDLLSELVGAALENDGVTVRLNVFGKYTVKKDVLSFRYLNKRDDVKFVVVDEEEQSLNDRLSSPKITLVAAFIAMVAFGLYSFFIKDDKAGNGAEKPSQKTEQSVEEKQEEVKTEKEVKSTKL